MDWNAGKAACHQAVIEGIVRPMNSWDDDRRDELAETFPGWDIWFVRHAGYKMNTWCARPKGAPVAIFHSWDSAELASKLERAETEVGKP